MIIRDLGAIMEISGHVHLAIADGTGEVLSAAVDSNLCMGLRLIGELTDRNTTGTLEVKLQESDASGGSYTDVSGATTGVLSADGTFEVDCSKLNAERFLKISITAGAVGVDAFALLLLYNSREEPNPL